MGTGETELAYGSVTVRSVRQQHLKDQGYNVNRKRIGRLMREMGIEAIYRKPRTSIPNKAHKVYPYLLRGLQIDRPNQVWATDIMYVAMGKRPRGFTDRVELGALARRSGDFRGAIFEYKETLKIENRTRFRTGDKQWIP